MTNLVERNLGYSFVNGLSVQGIRCFEKQRNWVTFTGQSGQVANWTIILGENGTGKTTVLQGIETAIAFLEWDSFKLPLGANDPDELEQFKRQFYLHRDFLGDMTKLSPDESKLRRLQCEFSYSHRNPETKHSFILEMMIGKITVDPKIPVRPLLPLLVGYASGRGGFNLWSDSFTGQSCLSATSHLIDPTNWLLRLDHSASREHGTTNIQKGRLTQVKNILCRILPGVESVAIEPGGGVYPSPTVLFKTPYGLVPLSDLSHGYQTVITWMVDFVSRLIDRYPASPNPLAEPAIALIDEIDLHLHPRWQRQLIEHLTILFPNTQFIVTAHNPLIVQAAAGQDANIVLLKRVGDHVEVINDLDHIRNWRIDQIYTSDLFDLPSARPPWQDALLARRTQILSQGRLSDADHKELSEIEQRLGTIVTGESIKVLRSEVQQVIDDVKSRKSKNTTPKRLKGKPAARKTKKP